MTSIPSSSYNYPSQSAYRPKHAAPQTANHALGSGPAYTPENAAKTPMPKTDPLLKTAGRIKIALEKSAAKLQDVRNASRSRPIAQEANASQLEHLSLARDRLATLSDEAEPIGRARSAHEPPSSEAESAGQTNALKYTVKAIRDNQVEAKKVGVDATRRSFATKALGVGLAALGLSAVIAASVATGGVALAVAVGITATVCVVSMGDATCAWMNYRNAKNYALGKPIEHNLPMGSSAIGNVLFWAYSKVSSKDGTPEDQKKAKRIIGLADGCIRLTMMIAGGVCTGSVFATAAVDSLARIAPLTGGIVGLAHGALRLIADRRSGRQYETRVADLKISFDGLQQSVDAARANLQLAYDQLEADGQVGKFDELMPDGQVKTLAAWEIHQALLDVDQLDAELDNLKSEVLRDVERMAGNVPGTGLDALSMVVDGVVLLSIFSPVVGEGITSMANELHIPPSLVPFADGPPIVVPFFASQTTGVLKETPKPARNETPSTPGTPVSEKEPLLRPQASDHGSLRSDEGPAPAENALLSERQDIDAIKNEVLVRATRFLKENRVAPSNQPIDRDAVLKAVDEFFKTSGYPRKT